MEKKPSIFKRFTNTFLWGYLALKWKRLFRVLTVFWLTVLVPVIMAEIGPGEFDELYELFFENLTFQNGYEAATITCLFIFMVLSPIFLISWVVKPFVMDKKETKYKD